MTTSPQRIQLSRKKGFNLQEASRALNGLEAVNVARPSRFGNPFCITRIAGGYFVLSDVNNNAVLATARDNQPLVKEAVQMFRLVLEDDAELRAEARKKLRGRNLACWCKSSPCHADVLLEIANGTEKVARKRERKGG